MLMIYNGDHDGEYDLKKKKKMARRKKRERERRNTIPSIVHRMASIVENDFRFE